VRIILLALLLGACSAQVNAVQPAIMKFTSADIANALADAQAAQDPVGEACWSKWLPISQIPVTGGAGTIQRARDLIVLSQTVCAPIIVAMTQLALQLQMMGANALLAAPLLAVVP
jgi:hypothetical protein